MDFKDTISKIKKTAIDTASTVAQSAKEGSAAIAKKSEELVEISKLTVTISSTEGKIKDIYAEIGKQLCEKHEHGMYVDPDLVENCNEVIRLKTAITDMKDAVQQLKNGKSYPEDEDSIESESFTNVDINSDTEDMMVEFSQPTESTEIEDNIEDTDTLKTISKTDDSI